MDWNSLANLGIELIRPLIWAFSVWISAPSIVKVINVILEWKRSKKEHKNEQERKDKTE